MLSESVNGVFIKITENYRSLCENFREVNFDTLMRKQNHAFAPAHSIWQNIALREESEFAQFPYGVPIKDCAKREKTAIAVRRASVSFLISLSLFSSARKQTVNSNFIRSSYD